MKVPADTMIEMYRMMNLIRRFEQRSSELFKAGKFPGWIHLGIGQEASATGACFALRADDYICPTHRGHGPCLAKGVSPERMMAELFGKRTGTNLGRGGSMHICDMERGVLPGVAILGDGLPLAVGAALSAKLSDRDRVALAFFGEGASNEGVVHEAMNIAALWELPVVFFCESNQYAELSHRSAHLKIVSLAERAAAYGMPGETTDGNDVLGVFQSVTAAAERARVGAGPTLIDSVTCRIHGHYEGDPQVYRIPGDLEEWREKDPIARLEKKLVADGLLSDEARTAILDEVEQVIASSVEFAESSPYPVPEEALDLVYV